MMELPEAFAKIIELAGRQQGVSGISHLAGCAEVSIDSRWSAAINGHAEERLYNPTKGMGSTIPPFGIAVFWNGWLAGLITPNGGEIAAHPEGANEDVLIAAIDVALGAGETAEA